MQLNLFRDRSQRDYSLRNCESICTIVLGGTYGLILSIAALLGMSLLTHYKAQSLTLLLVCVAAFLYVLIAHRLKHAGKHLAVAYMIVSFYLLLALSILYVWGINLPIGTLLLGLVIVLAGILLTARHSLIVALVASLSLVGLQGAFLLGWYTPNLAWTGNQPTMEDAIAYSVIFGMLALVSWLYNREMERSLAMSRQAELSLRRQKATLEKRVQERTDELRKAQLEEMRQMYRFTEIGQLGVTLLHDLANHLTALTLEIEDLEGKQKSKNIVQAQKIIAYLDEIVDHTRSRLYGSTKEHSFDIGKKVYGMVELLQHKAARKGVVIDWLPPDRICRTIGDSASLSQVMTILISNAIEAYSYPAKSPRHRGDHPKRVEVAMECSDTHTIIKIKDSGKGIAAQERRQLFKPFHSTKKTGLGLGLYIAKQSIEVHFGGTLTLNRVQSYTEFIIKIPLRHEKK